MQTLYKLTRNDRSTYGGFVWPIGEWVITSGHGSACSEGWTHWYLSPELAVIMNPIHMEIDLRTSIIWRGEGEIGLRDRQVKVMCAKARIIEQVPLPSITSEQLVEFGIRCANAVNKSPTWLAWANAWIDGRDRTETSAAAAAKAVLSAARAAAAEAATVAAVWAATAASRTAASRTADRSMMAEWEMSRVAYRAANAAATAAAVAVEGDPKLDLLSISKQVCGGQKDLAHNP